MLTFPPSRSWCPSSGGVRIISIRWRPMPTATVCTRKRSKLCNETMPICGVRCPTCSRSSPRWCACDKRERPSAAPFCSRFWSVWPEVKFNLPCNLMSSTSWTPWQDLSRFDFLLIDWNLGSKKLSTFSTLVHISRHNLPNMAL